MARPGRFDDDAATASELAPGAEEQRDRVPLAGVHCTQLAHAFAERSVAKEALLDDLGPEGRTEHDGHGEVAGDESQRAMSLSASCLRSASTKPVKNFGEEAPPKQALRKTMGAEANRCSS